MQSLITMVVFMKAAFAIITFLDCTSHVTAERGVATSVGIVTAAARARYQGTGRKLHARLQGQNTMGRGRFMVLITASMRSMDLEGRKRWSTCIMGME
jgi:hypothetical protein